MRYISVLSTADGRITCTQTLRKTVWVLRQRNNVRMESTRDIFDLLPSCRENATCRNLIPDSRTGAVRHRISHETVVSPTSRTTAGARAH